VRRPFDAEMPEVIDTDLNRAIALIKSRVHIYAQARDARQSV
jgi:hypothetical protein